MSKSVVVLFSIGIIELIYVCFLKEIMGGKYYFTFLQITSCFSEGIVHDLRAVKLVLSTISSNYR